MSKNTPSKFSDLHRLLCEYHLASLEEATEKGGELTHQNLKEIREFLRDNGVDDAGRAGSPLRSLVDEMPTFDEDLNDMVGGL